MNPTAALIYTMGMLSSLWFSWWLFANIHEALGMVGVGLVLINILWLLQDVAEACGNTARRRRRGYAR